MPGQYVEVQWKARTDEEEEKIGQILDIYTDNADGEVRYDIYWPLKEGKLTSNQGFKGKWD